MPSYRDYVASRSRMNPCLTTLVKHLDRESGSGYSAVVLDYPQKGGPRVERLGAAAAACISQFLRTPATIHGRILFVENIQPRTIGLLGESLDIDPVFFANHISTHFEDIEKAQPPPYLSLFPSRIVENNHLHIHCQRVIDLGSADEFSGSAYAFRTNSNVPRNVRLLPPLSGRQLGLARTCCSVLLKRFNNSWICLIIVDPPPEILVEIPNSEQPGTILGVGLHGGFEDFARPMPFSTYKTTGCNAWKKNSMMDSLLHYFRSNPPGFTPSQPSILSLGYYPMRIGLAEWMLYANLMSRYVKYYEYALHDVRGQLDGNDIADLQRWRRRSKQSLDKLALLNSFIDHWVHGEAEQQLWDTVQKDILHVHSQLAYFGQSFDQMVLAATSIARMLDSRRSILDAANIKRLSHIALVFVPLSWVASLFSMSDVYAPGSGRFWVYFATALPVLLLVLLLSDLHSEGRHAMRVPPDGWFPPSARARAPPRELRPWHGHECPFPEEVSGRNGNLHTTCAASGTQPPELTRRDGHPLGYGAN
ncbi:unnamed protein product [Parascedosporium putredinis]|uniref:Uncharacterized protein n=1 Tax=Parascedosporium putredinis TaxID=1442378 RepID=A0A9P1MDH8_9PEZI|nr:unnamed protein product [Parascedosporium putredinis]CAI8002589.1 unnamed protein product [Parascedosporium putredinis]